MTTGGFELEGFLKPLVVSGICDPKQNPSTTASQFEILAQG